MSFPVCKFFRSEQGCKFGNKCRYRHSDNFSPPFSSTAYDHQYQNDAPVNSHQVGISTPAFYPNHHSHYNGPVKSSDSAPANLDQNFQGLTTSDCNDEGALRSNPSEYSRSSQKICHYFARNGNCCFGSRCRFAHVRQCAAPPRFQQARPASATQETGADHQQTGYEEETKRGGNGVRHQGYNKPKFDPHPACIADTSVPGSGNEGPGAEDGGESPHDCQRGDGRKVAYKNPHTRPDRVCQFFLQGRCYKGRRCRFLHPRQKKDGFTEKAESLGKQERGGEGESIVSSQEAQENDAPSGQTKAGNAGKESSQEKQKNSPKDDSAKRPPAPRPPYIPQGIKKYKRDEVDDLEGSRLRRNEIDQLVKRFPKNKVKVSRDCAEYFQCFIDFSPTDPDWPFDVRIFQLQVDIPADYPLGMMTISLPVEQDLLETVRRYLEASIEEWLEDKEGELQDKGEVMLVFRPFLRWLDRNMEDIVTEGLRQMKRELMAKASGLEFISAKQLQKQYPGHTESNDQEEEEDEGDDEETSGSGDGDDEDDDDDDSSSDYYDDDSGEEGDDKDGDTKQRSKDEGEKSTRKTRLDRVKDMLAEPERRGTEVSLKGLQLKDSAAMMYFDKVCLVVQCERCRNTSEFTTSGGRVNVIQCGKCSQTQMCTFRPAMVHQFSPVMGYLDLEACLPFDVILQNCSTIVSCLNCSKETRPGLLTSGTPLDHWCRSCHQKLRVCTDGVRFTQLEPSGTLQSLKGMVKVVVPTRKRIPKDPAIQEGKPLPNFGTCKHYKKSYRWLRFPCCGKVYPCDICHDSKEDHENTYANRMICGFCCKEQVYAADRPCKGCDMNMTRVHTKHWEGGSGCRDKISMCRNDKAKHRNMSKTTSKHAQKVKDFQSKKKTKLRHA